MPDRPSEGARIIERRWRGLPRYFAIVITALGFVIIGHEIIELVLSLSDRLHTGAMLWGTSLLAFGLYLIQTGDVKKSLDGVVESGGKVREWFRRGRASDAPGTIVQTKVVTPPPAAHASETPPQKDTDLSGP